MEYKFDDINFKTEFIISFDCCSILSADKSFISNREYQDSPTVTHKSKVSSLFLKSNWAENNLRIKYMFEVGFFGTRAPFFMDLVTLIVALLPLLVAGAIAFARNKHYKVHAYVQITIFTFSVIVVSNNGAMSQCGSEQKV
ncbi:MAG: hypothetical protein COB73_05970 [Flavobacteriaceae bacterium]|nr:MAG: hypothetical protein COB73_05970 [Flavobacteriaceae bacterium]